MDANRQNAEKLTLAALTVADLAHLLGATPDVMGRM